MLWIAWLAILASIFYVVYRLINSRRCLPKIPPSYAAIPPLLSPKPTAPQRTGLAPRPLRLDKLPFDVCIEIFSYLSVRDLCVIERTSNSLYCMIRHHHTWSRVVSDIHQVKPPEYPIDLLSMTADELRAMAIRAVKLHHALGREFRPQRVSRVPLPAMSEVSRIHPYPGGRCIVAGRMGEFYLFSIPDGCCLDSIPQPYPYTPEIVVRYHWTVPIVVSASQAYLIHVVNSDEVVGTRYRFKEAIIRLFLIGDRTIHPLRQLPSDRKIISVSASSRHWAYVWWEEQARSFFLRVFPMSEDSDAPSEGISYQLQFPSPSLYPVTVAFVSDQYIMVADYRRVCVYLVPDSASSVSVLVPIWHHLDDTHPALGISSNPRVVVAPPNSEKLDALQFTLYWYGHLRTVRPPESNSIRVVSMSLARRTIYFFGATSIIIPEYGGDKDYHSISFLYASSPNRCTNRLECNKDTLVVHGDLQLFVDGECHLPRALCVDEQRGLLLATDFEFLYTYALF